MRRIKGGGFEANTRGRFTVFILALLCVPLVYGDIAAHWPLNGNADDISGNGRQGTVHGGTWQMSGWVDGAIELDGKDDFIEIEGYKGITGGASRSCCAWIKTTDGGSLNDIIGWGIAEPGRAWLISLVPGGYVYAGVYTGYRQTMTSVSDGQWHHIAVILQDDGSPDAAEITIYIDGALETHYSTVPFAINTAAGPNVQIGLYNFGDITTRYFKGEIDDVRIYERALNEQEIIAIGSKFAGGLGTAENPFQISTPEQLLSIRSNLLSKHFILLNDINMLEHPSPVFSGALIAPANSDGIFFSGSFNGNNHTINNLTISIPPDTESYSGLFGLIADGALVANLGIVNADIRLDMDSTAGGLAGLNGGTIRNCFVTGVLSGGFVGGLCGLNQSGTIENCCAKVYLSGNTCGGLVCENVYGGIISNCYAEGHIVDPPPSGARNGGLVSDNALATIEYCYSTAYVREGQALVDGNYQGIVISSFWDVQTSGQTSSDGGTGKTTVEMHDIETFLEAGWDFSDIDGDTAKWQMPADDYPRLSWEVIEPKYSGGSGTADDAYKISTAADWIELTENVMDWTASFILTADIDLKGISLPSVGKEDAPFRGILNGNDHIISNLTIDNPTSDYVGLFGCVNYSAEIKNLGLYNVNITGSQYVGSIVGAQFHSRVVNCFSQGSVHGNRYVGGLVGFNGPEMPMPQTRLPYPSVVENCCASVAVTSSEYGGGLVGRNSWSYISSCYATGETSANVCAGGLVGENDMASILSCFWDTNTSGTFDGVGNVSPDPIGVTGKTTAEMMTLATFTGAGWDFSESDGDGADWMMLREGEDYPRLAWQEIFAGDIAGLYGVDMVDFAKIARNWLEAGCPVNCEQADIDASGVVDLADFVTLAGNWMRE